MGTGFWGRQGPIVSQTLIRNRGLCRWELELPRGQAELSLLQCPPGPWTHLSPHWLLFFSQCPSPVSAPAPLSYTSPHSRWNTILSVALAIDLEMLTPEPKSQLPQCRHHPDLPVPTPVPTAAEDGNPPFPLTLLTPSPRWH